jgi:glycosyltransferase involved in cell wall biosynthesis
MDEQVDTHVNKAIQSDIVICIPVYNDWESVLVLIKQLDHEITQFESKVSILLVDDGSTEPLPEVLPKPPANIHKVEIVHLRRNVGHQRAIAIGLSFIQVNRPCQAVVVMDGDGEDDPKDVRKLFELGLQHNLNKIVFAKRSRRTEGIVFRLGYLSYKIIHFALTGLRVEVGNFSVVPFKFLNRLVGISELWNHYAGAVFRARLPIVMTPVARGYRIKGRSKMDLSSLVVHGMSAISVYGETVGVRLLFIVSLLMLFALGGLALTVSIKFFTDLAIPGWATNLSGILAIIFLNLLLLTVLSVILMLQSRDKMSFLPIRDWQYFVVNHRSIYG